MATPYFERAIEIRVGLPGTPGKSWTDVRTTFDITRTTRRDPGRAKVKLWNLDSASRGLIQQVGATILIRAGYGLIPGLIFAGDISTRGIKTTKERGDIVVSLEAGDGALAYEETRFDQSYGPGTPNSLIFLAILTAMGLGVVPGDALAPLTYARGLVFTGKASDAMQRLCEDVGQEWSIQDGLVQVLFPGSVRKTTAVLLTSETGMIGTPTRTKKGVNVRTLLNSSVVPGSFVSVFSEVYTGFAKAKTVKHTGDTHGQAWYTAVEAREVG